MRISVDPTKGLVQEQNGNEFDVNFDSYNVNGQNSRQHPFNNAWDDLQGFFDQRSGASSLTFEAYKAGFVMLFMRHGQEDSYYMTFQMPHEWNHTNVHPHLHLMPAAQVASGSTQNVILGYQYAWMPISGTFPNSWVTGSLTVPVSSGSFEQHTKVMIADVAPSNIPHVSDILLLRVARSGSNVLDTYTTSKVSGTALANIALLATDVHYQKINAGTVGEFDA